MTWLELKSDCLSCVACDLAQRRKNVVFGEGDPNSPLVLIGEGPGEQEDLSGRPFVGRAGQLLDRAIQAAGLQRSELFITNTVKCRAADWSTGKPINRAPTEAEAAACRRWLIPQLKLIAPKVILCVGAPSAKNLIKPNFAITKERGLYFESPYAKAVIATLHPSYVLRQMNVDGDRCYGLLVQDIKKAWDGAVRLKHKDFASETATTGQLFES